MSFMDLVMHPITQVLFDGVKYTAPKLLKVIQEQSAPQPVTESDIKQSAAETAQPDFGSEEPYHPYKDIGNESQT
ncbi:hypothetical protein HDG34_005894 [Paraburkholderia sp. HC6.4b]|uniref:hypothetical protein n=1 Tax=unclassified Paraburkholderia TaxID=2615204 RepID=UPI00161A2410|nr:MULTISPECIES: hypothetical protein [unclassified Paraburkholderia]MBB5411928.1 hypothetical protein [Paraburkholderia sp. HC6.4b]MBB5450240.1 hypothetical protein [Paraburkholderia sp. Kb1A]